MRFQRTPSRLCSFNIDEDINEMGFGYTDLGFQEVFDASDWWGVFSALKI
jgi:hypothetical protein